jgi:23S rRNA pseudouridine1911/1915/1917 synthase
VAGEAFNVDAVPGERLDVALGADPRVGSRAAAQKLIETGSVLVDGKSRQKRYMLRGGETISVTRRPPPATPDTRGAETVSYEIAYEDGDLIVVDKPTGVVVHPSAGHGEGTLAQALAERGAAGGPDDWRPGIVHRLDKDTSGLMVVAKSDEVHRRLQEAMRARQVRREYLALVDGRPGARSGTIDAPIGRDRRDRTVHSTLTDKPRAAITHFQIEEELPRTTLLRVRLETGRTHQIRVHLAAIGHPVCGDRQYGGGACGSRIGLSRQFLHSAKLRFRHPTTGAEIACESKLPADLCATYAAAAREPASEGPDGG